ncbi:hypothetical protein DFH94DRAFT_691480 [Russula ochroleuca]|jgi:ribosome assembly protein RRB1|uniref:Uncharacterized protein n=1 Tax=Russula ochroleuca TaxID=152965 RepID=A0A9P5MYM3_9AGAM|nr:hypothetical protein DFH94DRAFT_691480 [Russula ochroleuca]
MPKHAAVDAQPGPDKASCGASSQTREKPPEDEMGEFEDARKDEIEGDDNDDVAQSDGVRVIFCSQVHYTCAGGVCAPRGRMTADALTSRSDWPSILSTCSVMTTAISDTERQGFPASAYIVAGTQADAATKNQLTVWFSFFTLWWPGRLSAESAEPLKVVEPKS